MNPKAKRFRPNPCVICGYPFADEHHLYPRSRGGKNTIALCPNHHRAANIVQVMVERRLQAGTSFDQVVAFSKKYFDEKFNNIVWKLINAHCEEEKRVADEMYGHGE